MAMLLQAVLSQSRPTQRPVQELPHLLCVDILLQEERRCNGTAIPIPNAGVLHVGNRTVKSRGTSGKSVQTWRSDT